MKLGINLGSGQRRMTSDEEIHWVNVDCISRPPDQVPDVICNPLKESLIIEGMAEDFADVVVLFHNLEHYHWGAEMDSVVSQCYRILKPGGRFIVVVPDAQALAKRWLLGEIDDFIFNVNIYGAWQGEQGDNHCWSFSPASLRKYLGQWFKPVKTFDFKPLGTNQLPSDWWMASAEGVK